MSSCFCIGPQNGQPLCPCRMSALIVVNNRWVEMVDHGPAQTEPINDANVVEFKELYLEQMTSSSEVEQ